MPWLPEMEMIEQLIGGDLPLPLSAVCLIATSVLEKLSACIWAKASSFSPGRN